MQTLSAWTFGTFSGQESSSFRCFWSARAFVSSIDKKDYICILTNHLQMMKPPKKIMLLLALFAIIGPTAHADDPKTLSIGSKAPNFSLIGVDDKTYTLDSFKDANMLVIIFTCNHCPTAQPYEDRIIEFTAAYKPKGVQVVAISPNSAAAVRIDELGYSDQNDKDRKRGG